MRRRKGGESEQTMARFDKEANIRRATIIHYDEPSFIWKMKGNGRAAEKEVRKTQ